MATTGARSVNLILRARMQRPVPDEAYTVGAPPIGDIPNSIYVLTRVNLSDCEANHLTYSDDVAEARELVEEYALSDMAMRAARDKAFPQVDSEMHHPRMSLANKFGGGMDALAEFSIPMKDLRPGEYVVYFEPGEERIQLQRDDVERIYLGRRPHPEDDDYNPDDADVVVNLAYFNVTCVGPNVRAFLRARTDNSDAVMNDDVDL
jgi:hypothetical protein